MPVSLPRAFCATTIKTIENPFQLETKFTGESVRVRGTVQVLANNSPVAPSLSQTVSKVQRRKTRHRRPISLFLLLHSKPGSADASRLAAALARLRRGAGASSFALRRQFVDHVLQAVQAAEGQGKRSFPVDLALLFWDRRRLGVGTGLSGFWVRVWGVGGFILPLSAFPPLPLTLGWRRRMFGGFSTSLGVGVVCNCWSAGKGPVFNRDRLSGGGTRSSVQLGREKKKQVHEQSFHLDDLEVFLIIQFKSWRGKL